MGKNSGWFKRKNMPSETKFAGKQNISFREFPDFPNVCLRSQYSLPNSINNTKFQNIIQSDSEINVNQSDCKQQYSQLFLSHPTESDRLPLCPKHAQGYLCGYCSQHDLLLPSPYRRNQSYRRRKRLNSFPIRKRYRERKKRYTTSPKFVKKFTNITKVDPDIIELSFVYLSKTEPKTKLVQSFRVDSDNSTSLPEVVEPNIEQRAIIQTPEKAEISGCGEVLDITPDCNSDQSSTQDEGAINQITVVQNLAGTSDENLEGCVRDCKPENGKSQDKTNKVPCIDLYEMMRGVDGSQQSVRGCAMKLLAQNDVFTKGLGRIESYIKVQAKFSNIINILYVVGCMWCQCSNKEDQDKVNLLLFRLFEFAQGIKMTTDDERQFSNYAFDLAQFIDKRFSKFCKRGCEDDSPQCGYTECEDFSAVDIFLCFYQQGGIPLVCSESQVHQNS